MLMTVYSHSRLSCYEQCPQKFKLQYIDKVETEVEESIEAFLGSRVHETLEKLYKDLKFHKKNSLEDLISYFHKIWDDNWNDSIIIVKEEYGPDNYQAMAEKFITDYYNRYKPFDQGKTIALEQHILVNLDDSGDYKLQGCIDRLSEASDGFYEIHDYKTNSRLPLNDYIRSDRQLALYMIGVKSNYPDVKDVRLIWHFLAFDKEVDSTRSDKDLESLKKDTIELIDKIEGEEKFEASPSLICDWCEFKGVCRQWSHLYKIMEQPANEYMKDSGVQLINRYAELKQKQKQVTLDLYAELEKLEEAIIKFAEREKVDVVFGSQNKVRVKESDQYKFPAKHSKHREELEQLLKDKGLWDEVVQLDTSILSKIFSENQWDDELLRLLKDYVEIDRSKRLYISKISND
jgi:putative RecB family exonuclease